MSGPAETRKITDWRATSRFYRRSPGLGWLLALIAVPLLLGLIGSTGLDRSTRDSALTSPSVSASATLTPTDVPTSLLAPLSFSRNGNDVTLTADVPDDAARAALLDRVQSLLPDANVIDNLTVTPGVTTADLAGLDGVLKAGAALPDFGFSIGGDTVTLTGTAPSEDAKSQLEAAVRVAWPDLTVVNSVTVNAPAGPCTNLQADITGLLRTPINFDTNGATVASSSAPLITQLADKLKACPNAKASVTGHTDNTGSDAINVPLSAGRAKAVADALISNGVVADTVTSQGVGSAEPVAGNDTETGRAQNRRVEITVS